MISLPNSDVATDLVKSNGALASWEHVDEDITSVDGNNLTSDGSDGAGGVGTQQLILGFDFVGLAWDATLQIRAAVTGTFPLRAIQIYEGASDGPHFILVEDIVLTDSIQTIEIPKPYPDKYFEDLRLLLYFSGLTGNTLTVKALRLLINQRGSGGQSAQNTSILVPTFGSL